MRTIEDEITEILSRLPLSSGNDLDGFDIDTFVFLIRDDYLVNVKTRKTDDPRCLFIATGETSPKFQTLQELTNFLVERWLNKICYKGYQAYELIHEPQIVMLRFVTISRSDKYCVTGKIAINHNYVEKDE